MARTISEATKAEKNKVANIVTELYQIFLDDRTLYLCVWPNELEFYDEDGYEQTYSPAAISRRPIQTNKGMQVDRFRVQFDNVGQDWSGYVANYRLAGRKVNIWKVFLERVDIEEWLTWEQAFDQGVSWEDQVEQGDTWEDVAFVDVVGRDYKIKGDFPDRVELFTGYISEPKVTEKRIEITVKSALDELDTRLPGQKFSPQCPWTFGDPDTCGVEVPTEEDLDIIELTDGNRVVKLESLPDTNWKYGSLEVIDYAEGIDELRVIKDYDLGENKVELEFGLTEEVTIDNQATIKAGCSKVRDDDEKGCEFWDNKEYFGGFPALPKIRNIRQ